MKKNVGGFDRIARIIFGPLLILGGIAGYIGLIPVAFGPVPQALGSLILVLIGAILAVTAVTQKCPVNWVLGVDTYRTEPEESPIETAVPRQ